MTTKNKNPQKKLIDGCTGAGVLLLTSINKKTCAVLFLDSLMKRKDYPEGLFSIPGGTVSKDDKSLAMTACHELREESLNTVNIGPNLIAKMPSVDVQNIWPNHMGKFRCFCCYIDPPDPGTFRENKQLILNAKGTPRDFKETTEILICPIKTLDRVILSHLQQRSHSSIRNSMDLTDPTYIHSTDGFSGRTLQAYYKAKKTGVTELAKKIKLTSIITKHHQFLTGTTSYEY
jgi:hypothetical protein